MPDDAFSNFEVRSTSSSTISYTVSSLSSPRSKIVTGLRHTVRLIVSFYAILVLLCKVNTEGLLEHLDVSIPVATILHYSLIGDVLTNIAQTVSWWILCFTSVLTLCLCLRRDYTEESLLILQGLGIQTSTSSPYLLMSPTTTFIPTTQIQDIVIHEAFKGFQARFYLAVIVDGATEFVVVFPHLLPRLPILEVVWRGSRKCLYGSAG